MADDLDVSPIRNLVSTSDKNPGLAEERLGGFAPDMVHLTDNLLYGEIWHSPELSQRERSLLTVASLVSLYRTEQLPFHLRRALDNGLSLEEVHAAITHLAFYAGWPAAMSALTSLKEIADGD